MADEDDVRGANAAYYAAFNTRDAEAMNACWANRTAVACIHPGWRPLHGREDVMGSWRNIFQSGGAPKLEIDRETVVVVGDFAYVTCRERIAERSSQAGQALAATNVYVREDGAWRIVLHHAGPVARWEAARAEPGSAPDADEGRGSGGMLN